VEEKVEKVIRHRYLKEQEVLTLEEVVEDPEVIVFLQVDLEEAVLYI
tara:strand:+ start:665 stop:805 length:141 start_codon:yes stop_codon:yes gene_type:complete